MLGCWKPACQSYVVLAESVLSTAGCQVAFLRMHQWQHPTHGLDQLGPFIHLHVELVP